MYGSNSNRATNEIIRELSDDRLGFGADYFIASNPDANDNYQTITYKKGGANGEVVRIITLTFDANDNVVTYYKQ